MRVVLDTNVFISGIFWGGSPRTILELWAGDKIRIFVTRKILDEYIRVLQKIDPDGRVVQRWATFITGNSTVVQDRSFTKVCRDPEDNKFLDCAIMGRVRYLVSGDDDLLSLQRIGSIRIVNPAEFLKLIVF